VGGWLGLAAEIDKGVAILDYALDDRPSTGKGGSGRPAISPTYQGSIGSWRTDRRKGIGGHDATRRCVLADIE